MARIIFSGLINSINGSIGGTTFQRNRYGFTIKNKPRISNPNSVAQLRQQRQFQSVIQTWKTLSPADISTWNIYSETFPTPTRLNPNANQTGFNLFIRHAISNPFRVVSPLRRTLLNAYDFDQLSGGVIVHNSDGRLIYSQNYQGSVGRYTIVLYMTNSHPFTRKPRPNEFKSVGSILSSNYSEIDVTDRYREIFGILPAVNQTVSFFARAVGREIAQIITFNYTTVTVRS